MTQEYKVLGQRQTMNINPMGNGFTNDWEVTYQVTDGPAKGATSTVTIPAGDHNAEYVDGAVREQMQNLHGVAALGYSD
jgi:hypothetical protein